MVKLRGYSTMIESNATIGSSNTAEGEPLSTVSDPMRQSNMTNCDGLR